MRKSSFWALVAALAVGISLTAGAAAANQGPATAEGTPRPGGTVIFGADQEPPSLNNFLTNNNLYWANVIIAQVLEGAFTMTDKARYQPNMLTGQPTVRQRPFTVTYTLRKNMRWMNGPAITCADWQFTLAVYLNPKFDIVSRAGYEDIRRITCRGQQVIVHFKEPYAAWKDLFNAILPRHALQGEDFNRVWRDRINNPKTNRDISSGPFFIQNWQRGSQLTLARNPQFWGKKPFLNQVIFRFIPDTNTQFQQMRGGEVDAIAPQPQLQIADIRRQRGIVVQQGPEFAWEHLDIQLGPKGAEPLKRRFVRQAMIQGINRQAIVQALYREIAPGLPILNNVIYKPFETGKYQPNWNRHRYNRAAAQRLLQQNGCTRGGDGIYSCGGQRLSFRFFSTAGNQLRQLTFEIMQAQLKEVGIELKSNFGPARVVFGTVLPSGDWDLFLFTWIGSPDPAGSVEIHKCGGDQNYTGYCNRRVSQLLERSDSTVDETARTRLFNQADALMAQDIPTVPLFARPGFLIHKAAVRGMKKNPTQEGPTWNSQFWHRTAA